MAGRFETYYSTIASGATLGSAVGIIGARSVAVFIPTVTSGDFRLQGSHNGTNFAPTVTQSGRFARPTSVGSFCLGLPDDQVVFAYIKPETSVAQTDNRTLTFVVKG